MAISNREESKMRRIQLLVMFSLVGCGGLPPESPTDRPTDGQGALFIGDLNVDFAGCTESAGIGFVPAEKARPLVPARYVLAGDAANAVIVVRTVHCDQTTVGGLRSPPGSISQIGISLVGPDATADINNYTLWYTTTDPLLAAGLLAKGVKAELDPSLHITLLPSGTGGTLSVNDHPLLAPAYQLAGAVVTPTAAPVSFTASWWQNGLGGTSQMRTVLPAIRFSTATTTLTTDPHSALGRLIGGSSLTFPLLDSYNSFASAQMVVSRHLP